jgi:hypothetical protein
MTIYHKEHDQHCTPLSKLCATRLLLLLLQITDVTAVILILVVSYWLLRNRDKNLDQKQRTGEKDQGTRN